MKVKQKKLVYQYMIGNYIYLCQILNVSGDYLSVQGVSIILSHVAYDMIVIMTITMLIY